MSLEKLELDGKGPIYLQIVRFVRRGVVAGTIPDGEEMPSRRAVSALLGVNPNTVQKAYRMLEEEGVLSSRAGARSCVQADAEQIARIRESLLREEVGELVAALRQMGVSREEALREVDRQYRQSEGGSKGGEEE
ncbi:MAG: GntR family transcriptional regulator [Candidatus Spyradocola sp.]